MAIINIGLTSIVELSTCATIAVHLAALDFRPIKLIKYFAAVSLLLWTGRLQINTLSETGLTWENATLVSHAMSTIIIIVLGLLLSRPLSMRRYFLYWSLLSAVQAISLSVIVAEYTRLPLIVAV